MNRKRPISNPYWLCIPLAVLLWPALAEAAPPSVLLDSQSEHVGRVLGLQEGIRGTQPSYEGLTLPIRARVLDDRFITKRAMYLANEEILSGNGFMERALEAGLPVADDSDFINITTNESYWYSRYNLSWLLAKSRLGIHVVHGPYVTLKALRQRGTVFANRDRGEQELANREIVLGQLIPMYLDRTGFPRRFEDASPLVIEFESGDPHLTRRLDMNDDFEGGNGRMDFEDDYLSLRWDHDRMDKTIDMGGVGQTLIKQVLWSEYFFSQNHDDGAKLGNTAEDGFRGAMINLMQVSKMLLIKAALFFDGKKLVGINPIDYEPSEGLRYIPHRIYPDLIMAGDIPPRPQRYRVRDNSSQLFDQASLLWGVSEFLYYSDPDIHDNWDSVFGNNMPYDGSIMELKWRLLAQGLADTIVKNLLAMHLDAESGLLISQWTPAQHRGPVAYTHDLGLALVALANYHHRATPSVSLKEKADRLLKSQADLLIEKLQREDGSFAVGYDVARQTTLLDAPTLRAQGMAIRGLLAAYEQLHDERYSRAALRVYAFMNEVLWSAQVGVYRSEVGATTSIYTGLNLGAALGALREVVLLTKNKTDIERYKQFHVQALNRSGILLSEEGDTGEIDLTKVDADGDGIPHVKDAGGKYGVAAVHAAAVAIDTP